ncbi:LOW QUALITY PROTEIN: hypothetical protein Cgig2_026850 [Carnegiea gigantea]|uniref:Uncharacterized protein n=1 Tax=Carnegiea gigantea TaxID=171969 RepID=A0A9Q1KYD8_9CARY|nr:LOW QUALITY PROTEIN: hypothetical protein Cgig2_026850 [Carnegiea gigantea]
MQNFPSVAVQGLPKQAEANVDMEFNEIPYLKPPLPCFWDHQNFSWVNFRKKCGKHESTPPDCCEILPPSVRPYEASRIHHRTYNNNASRITDGKRLARMVRDVDSPSCNSFKLSGDPLGSTNDCEALPPGFVTPTSGKGIMCPGWAPQLKNLGSSIRMGIPVPLPQ